MGHVYIAAAMTAALLVSGSSVAAQQGGETRKTADLAASPRGGIFCDASGYSGWDQDFGLPLCLPGAAATGDCQKAIANKDGASFVIGAPQRGSRAFAYSVWFPPTGHNCSLEGTLKKQDGQWIYKGEKCTFALEEDAEYVALRVVGENPCTTSCGARASMGGVAAKWSDSLFQSPSDFAAKQIWETCSVEPNDFATDKAVSDDVLATIRVQRLLKTLGFIGIEHVTGEYGPATRAALAQFAAKNGLAFSGAITAKLIAALDAAAPPKPAISSSVDARTFIQDIYSDVGQTNGMIHLEKERWFTPRLVDLINYAEIQYLRRFDTDGPDFNPFNPGFASRISHLAVTSPRKCKDAIIVEVSFRSFDKPVELVFKLKEMNGGWLIDDIVNPTGRFSKRLAFL